MRGTAAEGAGGSGDAHDAAEPLQDAAAGGGVPHGGGREGGRPGGGDGGRDGAEVGEEGGEAALEAVELDAALHAARDRPLRARAGCKLEEGVALLRGYGGDLEDGAAVDREAALRQEQKGPRSVVDALSVGPRSP